MSSSKRKKRKRRLSSFTTTIAVLSFLLLLAWISNTLRLFGLRRAAGGGTLILHAGPPKHASTTIQEGALGAYREELREDGFVTYGSKDLSDLNRCLATLGVDACRGKAEFARLASFLGDARDGRWDVVLSTESYWDDRRALSKMPGRRADERANDGNHEEGEGSIERHSPLLQTYKDLFGRFGFSSVRVIIFYRRLFEFYPSAYFQKYKTRCGPAGRRRDTDRGAAAADDYAAIPELRSFLRMTNETTSMRHPALHLAKKFERYFDDVEIFNLHPPTGDRGARADGRPLVARFLCDVVAPNGRACAASSSPPRRPPGDARDVRRNEGRTLLYDRIAQAVLRSGDVLPPRAGRARRWSCAALRDRIRDRQERGAPGSRGWRDLPLRCPPRPELDWLLERSLASERALAPSFFRDGAIPEASADSSRRGHRDAFLGASNTTLCDADIDAIFSDKGWRAYFRDLEP